MILKDAKSGEVVTMRYGPAMEAVRAGTHVIAEGEDGGDKPARKKERAAKA